jgi:hypothetical protein
VLLPDALACSDDVELGGDAIGARLGEPKEKLAAIAHVRPATLGEVEHDA